MTCTVYLILAYKW